MLCVVIYWSTLVHVGFLKVPLAVRYLNKIHRKYRMGEECDIVGRNWIINIIDG